MAAFVAQLGESDALHAEHEGEFAAMMEVVGKAAMCQAKG
jgi:hypothetical protein